jgi:hypothetical protein
MISTAARSEDRWLFKAAGVGTFVLGLAYVVTVVLWFYVGKLPVTGAAWLTFIDGKRAVWWTILDLSVLTDVLFIPLALALYAALARVNKGATLITTALMGLFVPLDLAGTWSHYGSLITLSGQYADASLAQRAPLAAAANYGAAFVGSRVEAVYTMGLLSLAIALVSVIMLRSDYGRATAWSGIAGGFFGVLSVTGWSLPVLLNAIGVTVWAFLVAFRLCFRQGVPAETALTEPAEATAGNPADMTVEVS